MITRRTILTAALVSLTTTAYAQQTPRRGPNGGMIAGAAGHEVELVVNGQDVSVFSIEQNKAGSVTKARLRLVVQQGGQTTNHDLAVAEPTRLSARLPAPLAGGAIVVVSGRDDHGHTISARFVVSN